MFLKNMYKYFSAIYRQKYNFIFKIYRHVVTTESEGKEEEYGRMDRKSFKRLLTQLAEEKQLKLKVVKIE